MAAPAVFESEQTSTEPALRVVQPGEAMPPPPPAEELDEVWEQPAPGPRAGVARLSALAICCALLGAGAHALWVSAGIAPAAAAPEPTAPAAPEPAGAAVPSPGAESPAAPAPEPVAKVAQAELAGPADPGGAAVCKAEGTEQPRPRVRLLTLGMQLLEERKLKGAQWVFEQATRRHPRNPEGWYGLALARVELGDPVRARRAAERAHTLAPNHGPTLVLLGFLDQLRQDVPHSKARYQQYLARHPEGPWAAELASVLTTFEPAALASADDK